MTDLSTTVGKLRLRNPTILASGIMGDAGESLLRAARGGAGAVVTKSIGREPVEAGPGPSIVELDHGLLNGMGWANPGIDNYRAEVEVALQGQVPVIGSIFAEDVEFFGPLARAMELYGVNALELNLSAPHSSGLREISGDPELSAGAVAEVKSAVKVPVFAKLSPNGEIGRVASAVEEAGADGIVAVNLVRGASISPAVRKPVLGGAVGGLSGPMVKPIGIRCVYEIYEAVEIPVVGAGGVVSGLDAVEYIMAGARAVQIGSGVHYRGLEVFNGVCEEVGAYLEDNGFSRVEEMVGVAHG